MGLIAKDLPTLIFLLLPGFISAGVFYTLTAHPRTSEFERLIQSLIFTAFVRVAIYLVKPAIFILGRRRSFGVWDADVEFNWSIGLAIMIGLIFSLLTNRNWFHLTMSKIGICNRTSYPSEWYGTFINSRRYVILHMDGDWRLKGWPRDWPDQPDKGHFVIQHPEWVMDDNRAVPVSEDDRILIPAAEVKMVEFLKFPNEISADPKDVEESQQILINARKRAGEKENGSESPAAGT